MFWTRARLGWAAACIMATTAGAADVAAQTPTSLDWPCWRGPNRNGISLETGMNWDWPKEGLSPLWKTNVGPGFSSVIISNGKVFTTGKNTGGKGNEARLDAVWCVDADSGKVLWKSALPMYDEKFINVYDQGSCGTPAADDKAVYALNNRGGAAAFSATDGKILWEHDLSKDPGVGAPGYYWAASPLVAGNVVIHNGGSNGIALDRATGKTVWQSGTIAATHISPVLCEMDGKRATVLVSARDIAVVDSADGTILYSAPRAMRWTLNGPIYMDPIVAGSQIELAGNFLKCENKAIAFDTSSDAARKQNASVISGVGSSYCMPILWQGCVYAAHFTPRSSKDPGVNSKLIDFTYRCRDLTTGALKWEKENLTGTQLLVDGKIVLLGIEGALTVFHASPDGFKQAASTQVFTGYVDGQQGTHCVSAPAVAGGRIFCRKGGQLVCYDIRKK